jgi:hypothetical protein
LGAIIARVNRSEKLDELVQSVEELLARLPESLDPEITALRDKVDDGIFDAWKCISSRQLKPRAGVSAAALSISAAVGFSIVALSAKLLLERSRQTRLNDKKLKDGENRRRDRP